MLSLGFAILITQKKENEHYIYDKIECIYFSCRESRKMQEIKSRKISKAYIDKFISHVVTVERFNRL